jgi:hypothetical protein
MRWLWSPPPASVAAVLRYQLGVPQRSTSHSLTQRSLSLPLTRSSAICCAVSDLNSVPVSIFVIDEHMRPGALNS